MRYRSASCNQFLYRGCGGVPDDGYDNPYNRNFTFHTTYIYNDELRGHAPNMHQRQGETSYNNNFNPYPQQPDCPNPNEMYNGDRRPWNNNHSTNPSHYDYTKRPNKRRPSHLMDIWRSNYDEDEPPVDRYTFSRSNSSYNRRHDLKPVPFVDRPSSNRFKKEYREFIKKTSPTSTSKNKTVVADAKDNEPSNPSTSTSTEKELKPIPKPAEPKSVSDKKIADTKSTIAEKVIETAKDVITPQKNLPEPLVPKKTENSDSSVSSCENSSPTNKGKEMEDSQVKLKLPETTSAISPKTKNVPLSVDDKETAIDIENALKIITNKDLNKVETDKSKSFVERSPDTDERIIVDTEELCLFTIDDIDKNKSFLDELPYLGDNRIVDMDLGSPLPLIQQNNTPCMTQDELLFQLNEELGEDNTTEKPLKIVLDNSSTKSPTELMMNSPLSSIDDSGKSKITKRRSSHVEGYDDAKKLKRDRSSRRYSTYAENRIKDHHDRRSSTSSESSGSTRSKNKSPRDTVEELKESVTEEVKINPYYPSLSYYKIPKKKPTFSSPDRPFNSSISEIFDEYNNTKIAISQEVNKDNVKTRKGCDDYSKPEQKDNTDATIKQITSSPEVNKDIGKTKKVCDTPTIKQKTSQEVKVKDTTKAKKCTDHSKPGSVEEKPSISIADRKKLNVVKRDQKAKSLKEAKEAAKDKINKRTSPVKDAIKTSDKQIDIKKPKSKPSTGVSVTKSDKSRDLIVKENKKRVSSNAAKQDSSKSEKEIDKSDKKESTKRSKSQRIPEKRRKTSSGLSDADTSNLETKTVNLPLSPKKHSETIDQSNTQCAVKTSSDSCQDKSCSKQTDLGAVNRQSSKEKVNDQNKVNNKDEWTVNLPLSPKTHSETIDQSNTQDAVKPSSDLCQDKSGSKQTDLAVLNRQSSKEKINDQNKVNNKDQYTSLKDNLPISPSAVKISISSDDAGLFYPKPSNLETQTVLNRPSSEEKNDINDNCNWSKLTDDLPSSPIKHSELTVKSNTSAVKISLDADDAGQKCHSIRSNVDSEMVVDKPTSEEKNKNQSNVIELTNLVSTTNSSANVTTSNNITEVMDSNRLIELINKYFPAKPNQEVPCKAPDQQQTKTTTNLTEDKAIKTETSLNKIEIQIKTAFKLEHPDLEKMQPLIRVPFPPLEKPRISLVESECVEVAFVMDTPDLHENIETVIVKKIENENDSQDVIEIKEDVTIIDLTDDVEEVVLKEDLLEIMEKMESETTEKITLYRSEDNNEEDEEVQAMSASILPSAVLADKVTKTEPIKSEISFSVIENDNCVTISNAIEPEVETSNESTEDTQSNNESLPSLVKAVSAKTFLSVNKNLFEKDANNATEGNSETVKNSVEVSAGQTSASLPKLCRALNMPEVSPAAVSTPVATASQNQGVVNSADRIQAGPASSSSGVSVPNNSVQTANQTQECTRSGVSALNSSAASVNVTNDAGRAANQTQRNTMSNVPLPSFLLPNSTNSGAPVRVNVPNDSGSAANQNQSWTMSHVPLPSFSTPNSANSGAPASVNGPNDTGSAANQNQSWTRSDVPLPSLSAPNVTSSDVSAVRINVPNDTGSGANQNQKWANSDVSLPFFSVPNATVRSEQWTRSGASVSSSSAVGVPNNGAPAANPAQQWRSGGPAPSAISIAVPAVNQTQGWTTSDASASVVNGRGDLPSSSQQQVPRTLNDFQSQNQSNVRSIGATVNTPTAHSQINALPNNIPSSSSQPSHGSWHQCMADFVVLAIKNHVLGKQYLNYSNICALTYKVEQLVIDVRWKIYGDQIMMLLKNTTIEEMEPQDNIVKIYQRAQSLGLSSLPQFFLCLDAIMSHTKEFYLSHRSLWKFYQLVHANAMEIRQKANKAQQSVPSRPNLTQQQLETLNAQIDFCNAVMGTYNVPATSGRSGNNVSNPINGSLSQNSFPAQYNGPARSAKPAPTKVVRNQTPNTYAYRPMVPPQRPHQQPVNHQQQQQRFAGPSPLNNLNDYAQSSNVGNTPQRSYAISLKELLGKSEGVPSKRSKSTFKVPSQLRQVRKTATATDKAVNIPPNNSPSSYGTSPAYYSRNDGTSWRGDTPRYVIPSMTQIKKHIYAPMPFTPNYVLEKTPSPVSPSAMSPINESTVNQAPINGTSIAQAPINGTSIAQAPFNRSTANQTPAAGSHIIQAPDESAINPTPFNESRVTRTLQSPDNDVSLPVSELSSSSSNRTLVNYSPISSASVENDESSDSGTKVNEDDEMITIDLTCWDQYGCDELKQEVDFIDVKKEEFEEDEVILNAEQFPLTPSPADSGVESSPSPQVEYSELVYHGRLCICDRPAEYVCECRLAMYCSNSCQNSDWIQHKRICLKAKSKHTD